MLPGPDRPTLGPDYSGPRLAAIHGLMGRELMQQHLLRFIREADYPDTTMYGHLHPSWAIADDLEEAFSACRKVVLIGYSQGGFQAVKVARELDRRGVRVALLVTIAAGGLGRVLPNRWGSDPRRIPSNVSRSLNVFSVGDTLGSDKKPERNLIVPTSKQQDIHNIEFPESEGISHIQLVRCYPDSRVHPSVRTKFLDRLLSELAAVSGH